VPCRISCSFATHCTWPHPWVWLDTLHTSRWNLTRGCLLWMVGSHFGLDTLLSLSLVLPSSGFRSPGFWFWDPAVATPLHTHTCYTTTYLAPCLFLLGSHMPCPTHTHAPHILVHTLHFPLGLLPAFACLQLHPGLVTWITHLGLVPYQLVTLPHTRPHLCQFPLPPPQFALDCLGWFTHIPATPLPHPATWFKPVTLPPTFVVHHTLLPCRWVPWVLFHVDYPY